MKKIIFIFIWTVVLVIPVMYPLFTSFVPGTADGFAHKFRLVSFEKSIMEGNWRPRWIGDQALGMGAPIFLYNYLFPYYFITLIHQFTHSVNLSVQVYEALTLMFSFLFMYLAAEKRWGWRAGIVAAAIYTWAPYHLLSIYLYEGWGEFTSFMWPPLILALSVKGKAESNKQSNIRIYAEHFALILVWILFILSHNVSVLMFTPVLLGLGFLERGVRRGMRDIVVPFILAVCVSGFFWYPAVTTNSLTQYPHLIEKEMAMVGSYFKSLRTHYDIGVLTLTEKQATFWDFTIGIGIAAGVFGAIGVLLSRLPKWPKSLKGYEFIIGLLGVVVVGIILSNVVSVGLWRATPLQFVVYPFRFLFLSTFAGSLLAGWVSRKQISLVILFIVLAFLGGRAYLHPYVTIFPYPESYFYQPQTFTNPPGNKHNMGTEEFLPKWASRQYLEEVEAAYLSTGKLPEKILSTDPKGKIVVESSSQEQMSALVDQSVVSPVTINTFYFPNWQAMIDEKPVDVGKDGSGRIVIMMPQGVHRLKLLFGVSQSEKIGWWISGVGIVLVGVFLSRILRLPTSLK